MKKQLLAAAVAALASAGANAAAPTIDASTTAVFLSGASASLNYVTKVLTTTAGSICDASAPIWQFNDSVNGKTSNAFYCKAQAGLGLTTTNVLVFKRSDGGSYYGVGPVSTNQSIEFLNITSNGGASNSGCTVNTVAAVGTLGKVTCHYTSAPVTPTPVANQTTALSQGNGWTFAIPNVGISDVNPELFVGPNVPSGLTAITADNVASLNTNPGPAVVFGEPVTWSLFQALQAAQLAEGTLDSTCTIGNDTEKCLPNLTSAQIASLHTGLVPSWNNIHVNVGGVSTGLLDWVSNNANAAIKALKPAKDGVHVCRRDIGSGTQAAHGVHFLNTPCADAASATPAAPQNDTSNPTEGSTAVVHLANTSGALANCLDALDKGVSNGDLANSWGKRWAVGLQSLENSGHDNTTPANVKNYQFVKVDGLAPTLANVVAGKYGFWVENTLQVNAAALAGTATPAAANLTADQIAVASSLIGTIPSPAAMTAFNSGFVHNFATGAYLTPPSLAAATSTVYDPANPVSIYSHATGTAPVNNCRVPSLYTPDASGFQGNLGL